MPTFGIIGYPIKVSSSKELFTEKFKQLGLTDYHYELFPLPKAEGIIELTKEHPDLMGLNVTMPYKSQIIPYLHDIDFEAEQIGSVNTIKLLRGKYLIGFNTDVIGFEKSFKPLLQAHHKKALIFGSGGVSKSVAFVLAKLKIEYAVVSRNKGMGFMNYDELTQNNLSDYNILINCTPLGMSPFDGQYPNFPYELINERFLAYDLVYKPEETAFLQKAKAQGAVTKNGLEMLHIQADEAWKIWNK